MAYAGADDFTAYVADLPADAVAIPTGDALDRLLARAERDVDRIIGPWPRQEDSDLKLDPEELSEAQAAALSRAVCAQALYWLAVSEEELIGVDDRIASVAGVVTFAPRPVEPIGRQPIEELAGFELLLRTGLAPPEPEPEPE